MHPVVVGVDGRAVARDEQARRQRVPASVDRRHDNRVRVELHAGAEVRSAVRGGRALAWRSRRRGRRAPASARWNGCGYGSDQCSRRCRSSCAAWSRSWTGTCSAPPSGEHTVERGVVDRRQVRAGPQHVDVAHADARVDRPRPQEPHEVLEVADRARAEVPAVVVGQAAPHRPGPRTASRRRARRRRGGRVEAQPGEPSALERRHEERVVGGRFSSRLPRAHEPRIREVGVLRERAGEQGQHGAHVVRGRRRARRQERTVDVHVRPRPQLVGRRQRRRRSDRDRRQRPARNGRFGELALLQHDEREPRLEPPGRGVGRVGRVPPRKVLVVELDRGEVVRLEVRDPVARLGAQDRPRVDTDHVAGPVQGDRARDRRSQLPARERGRGQLQVDPNARAHGPRGGPAMRFARPWRSHGRNVYVAERRAHVAASNAGITCKSSSSRGSAAIRPASSSRAAASLRKRRCDGDVVGRRGDDVRLAAHHDAVAERHALALAAAARARRGSPRCRQGNGPRAGPETGRTAAGSGGSSCRRSLRRSGRRERPRAPRRTTGPARRGRRRPASARTAGARACRRPSRSRNCAAANGSVRVGDLREPAAGDVEREPVRVLRPLLSDARDPELERHRLLATRSVPSGCSRTSGAAGSGGRSVTSSELCAGSCGVQLSGLSSSPWSSASTSSSGRISPPSTPHVLSIVAEIEKNSRPTDARAVRVPRSRPLEREIEPDAEHADTERLQRDRSRHLRRPGARERTAGARRARSAPARCTS